LTRALYREFAAWLLPTAFATDHGPTLVTTLLEELRARRIVCPSLPAIERLAGSVRARAQRQLWRRLADGLTDQQRQALDQLLEVRVGGGQSTLAWLRQTAYAATTGNFPKLIERLTLVRALGVEPERATRVNQNHWLKIPREGGQSTVQHFSGARAAAALRYTHGPGAGTLGHTERRGTQYVRTSSRATIQEI